MKNEFFSLENFIQFHECVLHPVESNPTRDGHVNWQLQQMYEAGWMDCLKALQEEMNDTSTEDIIREAFE